MSLLPSPVTCGNTNHIQWLRFRPELSSAKAASYVSPRWANQIISYAAVGGVEWVALTDGAEWHIYNAHAPVPVEQKLFRKVKVDSSGPEVLETLLLLSTENMREPHSGTLA